MALFLSAQHDSLSRATLGTRARHRSPPRSRRRCSGELAWP